MTTLPATLGSAFELAAQELGMLSASRLFLRELSDHGGERVVRDARDDLGADYPVFDYAAARWLDDHPPGPVDPAPIVEALEGTQRVLVVGLETDHLDVLIEHLGDTEIGILRHSVGAQRDWRRVLANFRGRVSDVRLGDLHLWAGGKSAILTFVYGHDGIRAHVPASWLRVIGPDVRTSFRSLVGWDILGRPMDVYPRWFMEADAADFTTLLS